MKCMAPYMPTLKRNKKRAYERVRTHIPLFLSLFFLLAGRKLIFSYAPKSFFFCVAATPKAPEKPLEGMFWYAPAIYRLRLCSHVSGGFDAAISAANDFLYFFKASSGSEDVLPYLSTNCTIISPQFRNCC